MLQDYGVQQHAMHHHHGGPVPGMHDAQQMQVHDVMAHLTAEQLAMMHANLAAAGTPGGGQMDGQVGHIHFYCSGVAGHSWGLSKSLSMDAPLTLHGCTTSEAQRDGQGWLHEAKLSDVWLAQARCRAHVSMLTQAC